MFDAGRAVEVIARPVAATAKPGYGSGYRVGPGLVLTCAHIFPEDLITVELSLRDIARREFPATVVWRNRGDDVALLRENALADAHGQDLEVTAVSLAVLPPLTSADRIEFVMYGWPRAGDFSDPDSHRVARDPVQVDGEIKPSEYAGSKSGLLRLRPGDRYPAPTVGSYWMGMSGAAVFCAGQLIAVQVRQPQQQLPDYLGARPLTPDVLDRADETGATGSELLAAAGVRTGVVLPRRQVASGATDSARPTARAVRPYLLLETAELVGRREMQASVDAFLAGRGEQPVLLLFGVGGTGKSALAWSAWRSLRGTGGRRQFWYSFYDGRGVGSFQIMLHELARFLGLTGTAEGDTTVEDVLDDIVEDGITLFLDGIERCLRCYQRPLAVGDLDVVRVQETEARRWSSHDLGFADDRAMRFFLQLTEMRQCRVLATSRVLPSAYLTSGGALRPGVDARLVEGLDAADAAALLAEVGMDVGSDAAGR